jgi:hypothetical protein
VCRRLLKLMDVRNAKEMNLRNREHHCATGNQGTHLCAFIFFASRCSELGVPCCYFGQVAAGKDYQ